MSLVIRLKCSAMTRPRSHVHDKSNALTRWAIFAFKVYIICLPVVGVFCQVWASLVGWNDWREHYSTELLDKLDAQRWCVYLTIYAAAVLALFVRAGFVEDRSGRRSAFVFAIIGALLFLLMLPATYVPKTRGANLADPSVLRYCCTHTR